MRLFVGCLVVRFGVNLQGVVVSVEGGLVMGGVGGQFIHLNMID